MKDRKPIRLVHVVDDDEYYSFAVRKLLEINHFAEKLLFFPNGKEAMDYFALTLLQKDQLPDVILLDLNMPVMNGWDFLDYYTKISDKLPKKIDLYIVSSSISKSDIDRAESYAEVTAFLSKPLKKADLEKIHQKAEETQFS